MEIEEIIKNKVSLMHAGPAVKLMARKIGIDLEKNKIIGSGKKKCILKEDIQKYIKYNNKEIEEKNILSISAKKFT